MALQTVAKELAEHLGTHNSEQEIIKHNDGVIQYRMFTMLLWGVVALVAGMGVIALGKGHSTIGLLGTLLALGGALVAFYGVLSPLRAAALASRRDASQKAMPPTALNATGPATYFPEDTPSVTELTTRSLGATPETTTDERARNTQPT
jgi:hypothetical protein